MPVTQLILAVALLLGHPAGQQPAVAQDIAGLVRQLQAQDPWTREAAREALTGITDPAAVAPLLAALDAPDTDRKAIPILVAALRKFNDPRKVASLVAHGRRDPLLRDSIAGQLSTLGPPAIPALLAEAASCETLVEWDVFRAWSAGVLATMNDPGVDALLKLLRDPLPCRRAYAIAGMESAAGDPRAADAIRAAIDDGDTGVRNVVFTVIDNLLGPEAAAVSDFDFAPFVIPLTRRLRGDADVASRVDLIDMLERIGDARAVPAIRVMLKDEDESVREAAAQALKTLAPPPNPLGRASAQLQSTDPLVRIKGIAALAELDTNETTRMLPLLGDKDARVRRAAAEALGDLNVFVHDPREENDQDLASVPPLIAALGDAVADVRAAAARALGQIEDEAAVDALAACLADKDPAVVRASILALKTIASAKAGPPLAALYGTSDPATRVLVLSALWDACDPRTTPVLVEALADPVLRDAAGSALGCLLKKRRDPRAVDGLLAALAVTARPSFSFLEAVGATRDPRAVPLLAKLAGAGSEVRSWALSALGEIGDPRAAPILAIALRDPRAATRLDAAGALAKLENFQVTSEMVDALVDDDLGVRGWAATALARSHDPRAIAPLVRAMKTSPPAIVALGETKSTEAVDPLLAYLLDSNNDAANRGEAARALGQLGDPRAVASLIAVLNDSPASLAGASASALGAIGDARALEPLRDLERRLAASPDPRNAAVLRRIRDAIARISK